jgi:MFS family permease
MPASGILCQGIAAGLFGSASGSCDTATATAGAAQSTASFASDPLGNTANHFVEATVWFWGRLADIIDSTTATDFTNPGFLKTYVLMFGASSVLVVIFWLLAVGKRVIRGVAPGQAIGEAIGFLILAVFASAFTPAALGILMSLSNAATAGFATGIGTDAKQALTGLVNALNLVTPAAGAPGAGGPVVLILATVVGLIVGLILWLEVLLASAALYVLAVFGPAVLAELVDRDKWGHVHKWVGFVVALALVKPVIVVVIGLGFGLAGNAPADAAAAFSAVLSGLAILVLAVIASGLILKFVPIIGDHLSTGMDARRHLSSAGPAAAIPGPAQVMQNSISARRMGSAYTAAATKAAPVAAAAATPVAAVRAAASRTQPPTPAASSPSPPTRTSVAPTGSLWATEPTTPWYGAGTPPKSAQTPNPDPRSDGRRTP